MDQPLGLMHWIVIAIVVVLIITLIGVVRGPVARTRLLSEDSRPAASGRPA